MKFCIGIGFLFFLVGCHSGSGTTGGLDGNGPLGNGLSERDAGVLAQLVGSTQVSQSLNNYADSEPRLRPFRNAVKNRLTQSLSASSEDYDFGGSGCTNGSGAGRVDHPSQPLPSPENITPPEASRFSCACAGGTITFDIDLLAIPGRERFPVDGIFLPNKQYGENLTLKLNASCTHLRGELQMEIPLTLFSANPIWFEQNPLPPSEARPEEIQYWVNRVPDFEIGFGLALNGHIFGEVSASQGAGYSYPCDPDTVECHRRNNPPEETRSEVRKEVKENEGPTGSKVLELVGDPSTLALQRTAGEMESHTLIFENFFVGWLLNKTHAQQAAQLILQCQSKACAEAGMKSLIRSTMSGQGSILVDDHSYTAQQIINEIIQSSATSEDSAKNPMPRLF